MKIKTLNLLLAVPALTLTLAVQAHDPKEHMASAETPDCAAMNTMDHSKMDMNDPIVMAMMQQCMSTMKHSQNESEKGSHGQDHMNESHMKDDSKD